MRKHAFHIYRKYRFSHFSPMKRDSPLLTFQRVTFLQIKKKKRKERRKEKEKRRKNSARLNNLFPRASVISLCTTFPSYRASIAATSVTVMTSKLHAYARNNFVRTNARKSNVTFFSNLQPCSTREIDK